MFILKTVKMYCEDKVYSVTKLKTVLGNFRKMALRDITSSKESN